MTRLRPICLAHRQRGWAWLPAAIGAAASVLGGDQSRKLAHEQMDAQREFAQMGIRWKVADAKAAGIHPVYALGAQGATYSPVIQSIPDYGAMGQDLTRAFMSQQSDGDRLGQFMQQQDRLQQERDAQRFLAGDRADQQILRGQQIEANRLDLEARRLQLLKAMRELGPGAPGGGAAEFGAVQVKPSEQVSARRDLPGLEAAPTPGFKTYRYGNRSIDLPGEALSESLEGQGALGHVLSPILFGQHYYDKWGVGDWFSERMRRYDAWRRSNARRRSFVGPPER